jgi:hypothetical protein
VSWGARDRQPRQPCGPGGVREDEEGLYKGLVTQESLSLRSSFGIQEGSEYDRRYGMLGKLVWGPTVLHRLIPDLDELPYTIF